MVLTSREKPAEISPFEGDGDRVRILSLGGCWEVARGLITDRELVGSEAEKRRLCEFYGCSPMALKIVAAAIQTLFDGNIAAFLAEETLVFSGVRRLLDQQFKRLSALEQAVMIWLAINREWTNLATLQRDMLPTVARSRLMDALESLSWRSLVDTKAGQATQPPVIMEYLIEQLVVTCIDELLTGQINYFNLFALQKTTARDYIRVSQRRLILSPIGEGLRARLGSTAAIQQQLQTVLDDIRRQGEPRWAMP